ncbi:MAG: bifunctional metallophosphatase/5'-nucleotidase [Bacteriovorax sp.]|nr:bifunctional metallophosphatase/5'-nucleotidase [Bacteriovorax sp.]
MNKCLFFALIYSFVFAMPVESKVIQILHTNDTHSYLESARHDAHIGGAARLKALIDYYKLKAQEEGVKTLVFDAGDFLEGNLYYLAERGRKAFEIHNEMGLDFGALGNHDYLMGTKELDKILGEMDLKFSLVTANLKIGSQFKNIRNKIIPYKEFEIEGFKMAVLGLTTDEVYYKWRFEGGEVTDPIKAAKDYEKILSSRGNDFIIGLTHLGVLKDIELVEKTKYIDLVIGGHSHTALFKPAYVINKNKNVVPIVQAGMHTEYLGRIVVDLVKHRPLKILSYELIPVKYEARDEVIKGMVDEANFELEATYGKEWLNEKIGETDLRAHDINGSRKWAYFITDSMKEKTGADIAIHSPLMNGEDYPVGSITRRDLINSIPRVFELSEKFGWNIYTVKIKGVWLRAAFEALTHFKQPMAFSGLKMTREKTKHGLKFKRLLVNGKMINPFKVYTVAFTEGIVRGAKGISLYTNTILRHPIDTQFKIWATLEEAIGAKREKTIEISRMTEDNHESILPEEFLGESL